MEGLYLDRDTHTVIADMARGSMNAFGELYDSLSSRIFNYAKTITRDKEMAEDITHDILIQTLKHATRIEKVADPVAYIMVATRNHSYNVMKRESRVTVLSDGVIEIGAISSPVDRLLFEDAFSALPANQRETVYLRFICGYTYKEIASIQNAPLVSVKWRYGKAIAKLREYFKNNETEEKCDEYI